MTRKIIARQVHPALVENYWDYFNDIPKVVITEQRGYSRTIEYYTDERGREAIAFAYTWFGYEECDEFKNSLEELCQIHDLDEKVFKDLFVNADDCEEAECVTLNMICGGDWKSRIIRSYSTGEWATIYYDSKLYDDCDVDRIEAAYFGDITQWEVFNEEGEFIAAMFCELYVKDVSEYIGDILRSDFNISVESSEIELEWYA